MFDSGGSSGQLRDELGVLPPGDILKCALALSRNAREARRVLLARLPTLEHARLGGHTGGNLLLSMMQRYSGDFLDAIDGLRALLGCRGRVWPVSVQQASVCAEYGDGSMTRGEVEVDAGQIVRAASCGASGSSRRCRFIPPWRRRSPSSTPSIIGPGSFYTSLMPIFLVRGVSEALAEHEGAGHPDREPADRGARHGRVHGRRRRRAHRGGHPAPGGRRDHQHEVAVAAGPRPLRARAQGAARASARCRRTASWSAAEFWTGDIARHDRLRLAYAVWTVLSRRLLAAD